MNWLSVRVPRWSSRLTFAATTFTVVLLPLLIYFVPRSLEYDFTKLRVKNGGGKEVSEEAVLSNRVSDIFGGSTTPAVLLADRIDQVIPLCNEITRKNELDPPEKRVIDHCKTIYSYLPEDQDVKISLLRSIRKLLEDNSMNFLNEDQKKKMEEFKSGFVGKKTTLEDLPQNLIRGFREKNGDLGKLVYVSTTDRAPMWDGKNLMRFASMIRTNTLPNGDVLTASGDSVIFADLLKAVIHDGPRATVIAFLAVCLVVMLIFREKRGMAFIIGTLTIGTLWMGEMIALFHIKINFFNFIAIPTTFGIGVDYGCNVYQRYKLEGKGSLSKVLRTTGGAVMLCSITTIIGYLTLIIARNQALVSFGWIAIIGELTCLLAALVFVPAWVTRRETII